MTDRREWPARLVGLDRKSDIALFKIEAEDLPTVRSGIRRNFESASGCWRSARRSASRTRPPAASSRPRGAASPTSDTCHSSRRMWPSTRGQFGWTAVQSARRSGRNQLADLKPYRWFHGVVLRHPHRSGAARGRAAQGERVRPARLVGGVSVQEVSHALAEAYRLGAPRARAARARGRYPAGQSRLARSALRPGDVVLEYDGRPVARARAADLPRPGSVRPPPRTPRQNDRVPAWARQRRDPGDGR